MPRPRNDLLNGSDTHCLRVSLALDGDDVTPIGGYQIYAVVTGCRRCLDMPSGSVHTSRHEGLEIDAGHLIDLGKP